MCQVLSIIRLKLLANVDYFVRMVKEYGFKNMEDCFNVLILANFRKLV